MPNRFGFNVDRPSNYQRKRESIEGLKSSKIPRRVEKSAIDFASGKFYTGIQRDFGYITEPSKGLELQLKPKEELSKGSDNPEMSKRKNFVSPILQEIESQCQKIGGYIDTMHKYGIHNKKNKGKLDDIIGKAKFVANEDTFYHALAAPKNWGERSESYRKLSDFYHEESYRKLSDFYYKDIPEIFENVKKPLDLKGQKLKENYDEFINIIKGLADANLLTNRQRQGLEVRITESLFSARDQIKSGDLVERVNALQQCEAGLEQIVSDLHWYMVNDGENPNGKQWIEGKQSDYNKISKFIRNLDEEDAARNLEPGQKDALRIKFAPIDYLYNQADNLVRRGDFEGAAQKFAECEDKFKGLATNIEWYINVQEDGQTGKERIEQVAQEVGNLNVEILEFIESKGDEISSEQAASLEETTRHLEEQRHKANDLWAQADFKAAYENFQECRSKFQEMDEALHWYLERQGVHRSDRERIANIKEEMHNDYDRLYRTIGWNLYLKPEEKRGLKSVLASRNYESSPEYCEASQLIQQGDFTEAFGKLKECKASFEEKCIDIKWYIMREGDNPTGKEKIDIVQPQITKQSDRLAGLLKRGMREYGKDPFQFVLEAVSELKNVCKQAEEHFEAWQFRKAYKNYQKVYDGYEKICDKISWYIDKQEDGRTERETIDVMDKNWYPRLFSSVFNAGTLLTNDQRKGFLTRIDLFQNPQSAAILER